MTHENQLGEINLLREIKKTRQIQGENKRRWFSSENLDLTVWYTNANEIIGFQLCYDKTLEEKSYTWKLGEEPDHSVIDTGEHGGMRYKQTPILMPVGVPDCKYILQAFIEESSEIPKEIIDKVIDALLND